MGNLVSKQNLINFSLSLDNAMQKLAIAEAMPDPAMMGGDPSMMGGAPPMDPSMMGGAPPMDPSMMGGALPMDPSMMGGALPMDPAAAGGAPPMDPAADPTKKGGKAKDIDIIGNKIDKLFKLIVFMFKTMNLDVPADMLLDDPNSIPPVPDSTESDKSPAQEEADAGPQAIPPVGDAKSLIPISTPDGKTGDYKWGINISAVDKMSANVQKLKKFFS